MPAHDLLNYDRLTRASMYFDGIDQLCDVDVVPELVIRESAEELLDFNTLPAEIRRTKPHAAGSAAVHIACWEHLSDPNVLYGTP